MNSMDEAAVQAAYSRWASSYDRSFGLLFRAARRRAIELLELKPGGRVIEIGVGTGLSLPLMPRGSRLVGVDFSRPMLEHALLRMRTPSMPGTAMLVEGDGGNLPFADETFDAALVPFVLSAAPQPVALLHDMHRVCRPGARLVLLNHFSPRNAFFAKLENSVSMITSRLLGFHADFPLEPLFERAEMKIDSVERATRLGSWYIVTLTRSAS